MKKQRTSEMLRFENWLWKNYNPAEVFEDWAEKTTEAIMSLSIVAELDPTEIVLPLSDAIFKPLSELHALFRTPVEEREPGERIFGFYPGEALTEEELRWVALHIQSSLIPAA